MQNVYRKRTSLLLPHKCSPPPWQASTLHLSPLAFGAVIDSHRASRAKIISIQADNIILVENKTNFHELIRQNVSKHILVIYTGGFPGLDHFPCSWNKLN
ncbi:MAG: hypothetical protein KGZ63_12540 [Clostridiales bacterium]|nr:hypothetical protein [Clostridiales bacterium]